MSDGLSIRRGKRIVGRSNARRAQSRERFPAKPKREENEREQRN